ncbi:MAG: MXAN_6577-like cysteine-rich protein, partial [Deltaproteobacteria bacterium]
MRALIVVAAFFALSACGGVAVSMDGGADVAVDHALCATTELFCASRCVAPRTSAVHCGACDHPCAAGAACVAGVCAGGACAGSTVRCTDRCVDTLVDPAHCGGCDTACAAGQICLSGACVAPCATGLSRCDATCVDLASDAGHCGGCGVVCATDYACTGGLCQYTGCPAGQVVCA